MLPFARENNKARYIGYRSSGFTVREAVQLTGIHEKTLHRWRDPNGEYYDPAFVEAEARLPELRACLGNEYVHLEFLRNYRLILEKDFKIISDSIKRPTDLSQQEHQYLLKARSHYTPEHLQTLQDMLSGEKTGKSFDFTEFIMTMERKDTKVVVHGVKEQAVEGEFHELSESEM